MITLSAVDLRRLREIMLRPGKNSSVVDTCKEAMPTLISSLRNPHITLDALAETIESVAVAMDIAEVFPREYTERRPWEWYLLAAAARASHADLLETAITSYDSLDMSRAEVFSDEATALFVLAWGRLVLLSPDVGVSEYFQNKVLPLLDSLMSTG